MAAPLIGRTVRRLRSEQGFTQQALAGRLGISASYLNLIEHEQRPVTASLLIKLAETLKVDLAALSGSQERQLEAGLREVFADPLLDQQVETKDIAALASESPAAARAVLALYRNWRVAREESSGIALPSGRRLLLPHEEARDAFHERSNHFPDLEHAAESVGAALPPAPSDRDHEVIERLRQVHGLHVQVGSLEGALRRYDPAARVLLLSEQLPRESQSFHLAFQLVLLEARDAIEAQIAAIAPSSTEAASLIRLGLLNYTTAALLMPYERFRTAASELRHDIEALAARFGASFEQVCHRLSSLQRPGARGVPFFFLRVDPAGNVSKRFSAAGFPFSRFGGSCPRWVVHGAFAQPGRIHVQVAALPDGATFLCFACAVTGRAAAWGEPPPTHVVAMGCDIAHAESLVYADGLDLARAAVGIGLSCRLCDRPNCRSRAFPPLEHRLALDPTLGSDSPYRFEPKPPRR
ncbi:MAG TPA: short-chain fatty acyl-CoA regulator family protein [Acetobacteraceae bacterium]|nr:short-chain fatty acyl-CoA regulator family protein [Acetobacteraceae bacterium]